MVRDTPLHRARGPVHAVPRGAAPCTRGTGRGRCQPTGRLPAGRARHRPRSGRGRALHRRRHPRGGRARSLGRDHVGPQGLPGRRARSSLTAGGGAADVFLGEGMPFYVNCAVYVDHVLLGIVDVWLVGRGTGGELDSREWHAGADCLDATLLRDKAFSRAGLSLEHITPTRFRGDPAGFAQALRSEADRRTSSGIPEPSGLRLKPRGPLLR